MAIPGQKNLTVGIDATSLIYNRGVSRYTSNIVRSLAALPDAPTLRLFGSSFRANRQLRQLYTALQDDAQIKTKPTILAFPPAFLSRMWYKIGRLHIESLMPKVDVFHAWEDLVPPSYKTPIVATIHDLALFKFSDGLSHASTKEKHKQALLRLKQYHAQIIAVSQSTKRDLQELFSFDEQQITVIPEAVPQESIVETENLYTDAEFRDLGIMKKYFLWVGTNEPRKNLDRLMEAWRSFKDTHDLVLVGPHSLQDIPFEPGLKILTSVDSRALASLYTRAEGLTYPSLYEGFGLPILEAFHYHCPVVTANNSGMQEVGDDAAILIDPFSVKSIKNGMAKVIEEQKSSRRIEAMQKRLSLYSWEKSAKQTLAVYTKAAQAGFSSRP